MTWEEKRTLWEKVMGIRTDSGEVGSLFEGGGICERLYERISAAQHRLLDRLGLQESRDLDEILSLEDEICMHVAIRMFDYGTNWGKASSRLISTEKTASFLSDQLLGVLPGDVDEKAAREGRIQI